MGRFESPYWRNRMRRKNGQSGRTPPHTRRISLPSGRGGLFAVRPSQRRGVLHVRCSDEPPVLYVVPPWEAVRRDHNSLLININQVIVRVGWLKGILRRVGVKGWNAWVDFLFANNLVCQVWRNDETPPLFTMTFDFAGGDFAGMQLDHVDLRFANLHRAKFVGASLQKAKFHLSDISGADFTGAILDGIRLEMSTYEADEPPKGLSDDLLNQCEALG